MRHLSTIQQTCNSVTVALDPQVELISIVQHISRYRETFPFLLHAETSAYRQEVKAHSGPYAGHPAVTLFDEISPDPG